MSEFIYGYIGGVLSMIIIIPVFAPVFMKWFLKRKANKFMNDVNSYVGGLSTIFFGQNNQKEVKNNGTNEENSSRS